QAVALDAAARGEGRRLAVLLQVNLADDPRKQGLREADALAWVRPWPFDHLAMHGIMVIGPAEGDPDAVATVFQRGAHLFRLLREELGPGVDALSMGMSEDFELAVRAGATDLRIGRYLADAWAAPAPG
ncbi:MAG TPA: YggS family pyridoxal phosphate-dependent enzyme, partial [Thermoplasmata archaeon]|nr:YggS family pyridoxal phosphate-dependent enzyme [Thermoplasmata archaeon]